MYVSEAVATRRSVRAFLPDAVPRETIERVLERAARAPSGGNVQPWQLFALSGASLDAFTALMRRRIVEAPAGELPLEYDIYPKSLKAPYRDYRFKNGEDFYDLLGIPRGDKAARMQWFARNFQFFGAPLALFCFVDKQMGRPQWSDLGMYLQTVMLLLREEELDSCAQECWSLFHHTVRDFLGAHEELTLFCGLAIGRADPDALVNSFAAERATLPQFCTFI